MAESAALPVDVFIDPRAIAGQETAVVQALTALGLAPRVRELPRRRGAEPLQWIILAALPLQAFLSVVGAKVAEDAYRGLQAAVRAALGRSPTASRPMILQDTASGLQIVLDPGLPEQAYAQLLDLDLTQYRFGPIRYDRVRQRWYSDLDEARPPRSQDG